MHQHQQKERLVRKEEFLKLIQNHSATIMGILNLSPESYCETGRKESIEDAVSYALKMQREGAEIIDIGAEPTNPARDNPNSSTEYQLSRILPVVRGIKQKSSVYLSIDTSDPIVMEECLRLGVDLINDVRALQAPGAVEVVSRRQVPVCLMHMLNPFKEQSPQIKPSGGEDSYWQEIISFLEGRALVCVEHGLPKDHIILDPGVGGGHFGKNMRENIFIIRNLSDLGRLGFSVLLGVSRKSFIGELLDLPVEQRLVGSLAFISKAVLEGSAQIVRCHDVWETNNFVMSLETLKEKVSS